MKSLVNGELFKAITTKKLVPFPSTAGSNSREQSLDLCVNRLLDLIKNFYASLKKCKGRLGLEAGVLFSPAVKKKKKKKKGGRFLFFTTLQFIQSSWPLWWVVNEGWRDKEQKWAKEKVKRKHTHTQLELDAPQQGLLHQVLWWRLTDTSEN